MAVSAFARPDLAWRCPSEHCPAADGVRLLAFVRDQPLDTWALRVPLQPPRLRIQPLYGSKCLVASKLG